MAELILHPDAESEMNSAIDWYGERDPYVAVNFEAALAKILRTIADNTRFYGWRDNVYREARVRGFPYCVIYRVVDSEIVSVIAIAHTSRDPDYWRPRVAGDK